MNKIIWIVAGLFLLSLTLGSSFTGSNWDMTVRSVLAQDDGPALSGSSQPRQNESKESSENSATNKSNPAPASEAEQSDSVMPRMDPAEDSPDAPVKMNVKGPVEEKPAPQKAEEQKQPATEAEPVKPAEISGGDKAAADSSSQPEEAAAETKPKRELTPAQVALRDKVRRTIAAYQKMPFNTRQNTADEIIDYCLALGCNAEISLFDAGREMRANGITCLCWNYPCGGYEPLIMVDGHISARLGYGAQSRPSQLLAALALARVQPNYPMRVGDTVRTIADLVESEKLSCRSGTDMSLKLVGLAYYADTATWKNDLDEEWSLERIIKEELAKPTLAPAGAGLNCLLGLSYALIRQEKRDLPIEGQFARVKKYINDFHNYALRLQNSDGSWGYYLSGKGVNRDVAAGLRSSGFVLEWLTISLPEDRLDDPGVASGIAYLNNTLGQRYQNNLPALSTQEIAGAMRALHAMAIYDERFFKPADPDDPPAEKKPAPATAKRETGSEQSR